MSRTISALLRSALYSQESGEVAVVLFTMTHVDWPGTFRVCTDPTTRLSDTPLTYGIVSNGQTFTYHPMQVSLPDDIDERAPTARLVIDNINRDLVAFARTVQGPGACTIQIVLASTPNVVEITFPALDIRGVSGNDQALTVEFGIDALETEPFPAGKFVPSQFPGLF